MRETVRKLKTEMVVLVTGDLKRGYSHYGPFASDEEARTWANAQMPGFSYQLMRLYNPLKGAGREGGAAALAGN